MANEVALFTEEMRKTHTILVPNMLPIQLGLVCNIMRGAGYHMELLGSTGQNIVQQGLRNVHNDTCYPALLVIGQLLDAIQSGKYDTHNIALILPQTGGGCRASNYIHLMRKALKQNGYDYIPVISLNFTGLEAHPGFKLSKTLLIQLVYGLLLGDLMMLLAHQCTPYEVHEGDTARMVERCSERIAVQFAQTSFVSYRTVQTWMDEILKAFASIERDTRKQKKRVGIVGEIYVKFSPLGNHHLEDFLLAEGCEVVLPGLLDFCLYCIYNGIIDRKLYGRSLGHALVSKVAYRFATSKQADMIQKIKCHGVFRPPMPFDKVREKSRRIMHEGVKMGEGWLLPAEMVELLEEGVHNIICTQPFGCLPNHIAGKGMLRTLRMHYPQANIVAVDYDPGASQINLENRIKLMLSVAK